MQGDERAERRARPWATSGRGGRVCGRAGPTLWDDGRKSAASAALNCAEGAARQTRADKSRAYSIALCECCEACAAIEIAGALGACSAADVQAVVLPGTRVKNILSRLVR
jgi:four helix bundle protein